MMLESKDIYKILRDSVGQVLESYSVNREEDVAAY